MSITVDEFMRLKKICNPKIEAPKPLTDEIISEAASRLSKFAVARLEAAKSVPSDKWKTLVFPRRDGLGNLTPNGVIQALGHAFWALESVARQIAREKVMEPADARIMADGTVRCPWCGKPIHLQKERDRGPDV